MKQRPFLLLAAALALLVGALALKALPIEPPSLRTASEGGFDTARAMRRLHRILGDGRPHPVDSAANDVTRNRLMAEMRGVGLDPQVTDDFACNAFERAPVVACARIRNVLATIGRGRPGPHLLVVAHYDSSPAGPGAADDGIGMAALLETAALLNGVALSRPVTFLITDGEEIGLLGARAFLERNPLAARVDAVVNLEARGTTGPAIMFETSRPNGSALAALRSDRPVANSLTADFYRLIPNSTDVAVFDERPWTILNFAIIGNETRYHSAGDTLAALDWRSVQHMGDQVLGTVQHLATQGTPQAAGERHYLDIAGRTLLVVPAMLSFVLLAILAVFFARTAWRRRAGLGLGIAVVFAGLADAAILTWLGQWLIGLARGGQWWRAHPEGVSLAVSVSALAACAAAMVLVRGRPAETLRAAFWLVYLVLAILICVVAPGGALLLVLPALVAAIGIGRRWERAASITAAALLFLLFAPLLFLVEALLGHGSAWTFAPLAALILWPWLIELRPLFAVARASLVAAGLGATLVAGWAWAALQPAYSADRQQRFAIEYGWDSDARRGRWVIAHDGAPLPPAMTALGPWQLEEVPWSVSRRPVAAAPALPLDPPRVTVIERRETTGGGAIRLRLESAGLDAVALRGAPGTRLRAVHAGGQRSELIPADGDTRPLLRCHGRSCDGATFELFVDGREPAEWVAIGTRYALPAEARPLLAARPADARPQYSPDLSVVTARLRF
jgi:hypothetical protein